MLTVMPNSAEWDKARAECMLTASELPALFGVGYVSPQKLWRAKTHNETDSERRDSNPFRDSIMQRGHDLEPVALDSWSKRTGKKLHPGHLWTLEVDGMLLGATPDAEHYSRQVIQTNFDDTPIATPSYDGPKELVEAKCPITLDSVTEYSDKHFRYALQQLQQNHVSDAWMNHLVIWHPDEGMLLTYVRPEPEIWERCVLPVIREFASYVRAERPVPRNFTENHGDLTMRCRRIMKKMFRT